VARSSRFAFDPASLEPLLGGRLPAAEIAALAEAVGRRQPTAARLRRDAEESLLPWPLEPVAWYRLAGWPADATPRPSRTLAYAAGDYYLQDAGSLLALAAAGSDETPAPTAGLRVCDLCGSPGGKATALVEAAGPDGLVVANEPIRGRLPPLVFNLARTGSDRYAVMSLDPEQLADRLPAAFDLVLVDAPCSGQALLGRGKQQPSALSPRQVGLNAARQRRILAAAVRLLRPGGRLIYSTCTFAEEENERQVAWLMEDHGLLPDHVPRLEPYRSDGSLPAYRIWPHRDRSAGAFAASLRVPADGEPAADRFPAAGPSGRALGSSTGGQFRSGSRPPNANGRDRRRPPAEPLSRDCRQLLASLGCDSGGVELITSGSVVQGWPADLPVELRSLAVAGPEWFHRTGSTWRPAHALAVRRDAAVAGVAALAASDEEAAAYLRGEPVAIPPGDEPWLRITWRGRPLGWVKRDGSRGKNHLPPAARLPIE
jgi:16S rRNA C967 or C1407 C5-methylase (RsmB/RsmF family)